jgi:hypothetical protein
MIVIGLPVGGGIVDLQRLSGDAMLCGWQGCRLPYSYGPSLVGWLCRSVNVEYGASMSGADVLDEATDTGLGRSRQFNRARIEPVGDGQRCAFWCACCFLLVGLRR